MYAIKAAVKAAVRQVTHEADRHERTARAWGGRGTAALHAHRERGDREPSRQDHAAVTHADSVSRAYLNVAQRERDTAARLRATLRTIR